METIYLLFVILTDQSGYETMLPVTNTKHHSMLECKVERVQHKDIKDKVQFFVAMRQSILIKNSVYTKRL